MKIYLVGLLAVFTLTGCGLKKDLAPPTRQAQMNFPFTGKWRDVCGPSGSGSAISLVTISGAGKIHMEETIFSTKDCSGTSSSVTVDMDYRFVNGDEKRATVVLSDIVQIPAPVGAVTKTLILELVLQDKDTAFGFYHGGSYIDASGELKVMTANEAAELPTLALNRI